jgi:hypothetical protein
MLRHDI